MVKSMTGFGKGEATLQNKKITVEIRSLNSKQLDLGLRLPAVYRQSEYEIRNIITRTVQRGKVDVFVTVESQTVETPARINKEVFAAYAGQLRDAAQNARLNYAGIGWDSAALQAIMRLPDVVSTETESISDEEHAALVAATEAAVAQLDAFRLQEGAILIADLLRRVREDAERETIRAVRNPVLVVNAGIAIFGDALDQDPDAIDRLFRINVQSPYHASVEAARQMPSGGRIIVIGSVNGDRMPIPGMASYALSKSALQGMARGLARDLGPRGITINIVQPGPIDTEANPANGPMKDLMHSFMAIKRHGRAEEVAGMVAWLAGPEAGFVTGAMHTIDGAFGA